jgi:hypothetical protein
MRFAWLRENSANNVSVKPGFTNRLIYIAYNALYWVPILLPFLGIIDYRTGFNLLAIVLIVRLAANLYRNNVLTLAQAEVFPLRSP